MANGSKETDSESTDEEGAGDDNGEEKDDKRTHFEADCSRSGRRVTRYMIWNADLKCSEILIWIFFQHLKMLTWFFRRNEILKLLALSTCIWNFNKNINLFDACENYSISLESKVSV